MSYLFNFPSKNIDMPNVKGIIYYCICSYLFWYSSWYRPVAAGGILFVWGGAICLLSAPRAHPFIKAIRVSGPNHMLLKKKNNNTHWHAGGPGAWITGAAPCMDGPSLV